MIRSRLAHNAAALYGVQFASFVLPLITLPYLARVLGPAEFGAVVFAQAFATWLAVLPEWGFMFVGARDVAAARDDRGRLRTVTSEIVGAQLLLAVATVPLAAVAFGAASIFRGDPLLMLFAWIAAIAQGLNPIWYFQGVERLRLTAAAEITGRVTTVILILLLVKGESDGWIVLALQAGTGVAGVGALLFIMLRAARPHRPRWRASLAALRRGIYVFVSQAATGIYSRANAFVLGLLVTPVQVAAFAAPEKLTQASTRLLFPVSQAGYPRLVAAFAARDEIAARRLFLRLGAVIVATALLLGAGLFAAAEPLVVLVFGDDYRGAVPVLRILAVGLPLVSISHVMATMWLLPQGSDRTNTAIVVGVGVCNLVLALALAPAYGAKGMAWAVVITQAASAIALLVSSRSTATPLSLRAPPASVSQAST